MNSILDDVKKFLDSHGLLEKKEGEFGSDSMKYRVRTSMETVGGKYIKINLPQRSKNFYHGSEYEIECSEPFRVSGLMTTFLNKEVVVDILKILKEKYGCEIFDIHRYDNIHIKSYHIHFVCKNTTSENAMNLLGYLINN